LKTKLKKLKRDKPLDEQWRLVSKALPTEDEEVDPVIDLVRLQNITDQLEQGVTDEPEDAADGTPTDSERWLDDVNMGTPDSEEQEKEKEKGAEDH